MEVTVYSDFNKIASHCVIIDHASGTLALSHVMSHLSSLINSLPIAELLVSDPMYECIENLRHDATNYREINTGAIIINQKL